MAAFSLQRHFTTENMTETQALLAEFVKNHSEAAFREIVARYLNLVYSTALRLVGGDAHRAEDVAQSVFLHLAQKAHTLTADSALGGWLHRDTCHVAATLMRGERRRQLREQHAAAMNSLLDHSEANLSQIAPVLDEAINELDTEDRAAILLRFYEQRDLRSVGEALGSSENAAQKRVARALEELRSLLKHRGVALSAAALGSLLAADAVTAAPAGLVASISTSALAGAAKGTGTLTLIKIMAATNLKSAAVIIAASILTPLLVQHQAQARLQDQNASLLQQSNQLAQLTTDNQHLASQLNQTNSRPAADPQLDELLKLRSEVGRLQRTVVQMKTADPDHPMSRDEKLAFLRNKSAAQAARLKQWLADHPSEWIPELKNRKEADWIDSAGSIGDGSDDKDFERAMANLRINAESGPMHQLGKAALAYSQANNGQIPSDLSQVTPYLQKPMDADIMQRYEIVPSSALVTNPLSGSWVVTPVASVNPDFEAREIFGPNQQGRLSGTFLQPSVTNRWTLLQQ